MKELRLVFSQQMLNLPRSVDKHARSESRVLGAFGKTARLLVIATQYTCIELKNLDQENRKTPSYGL